MKESYGEGVASHSGPESCVRHREVAGEALTGVHTGQPLSCENNNVPGADVVKRSGRQQRCVRYARVHTEPGVVEDPVHVWKLLEREAGGLIDAHC